MRSAGFPRRWRTLAQRLGRRWFFLVGIYLVLFLAICFLIDLPLNYYEGFVRQHAYGMSNQTLAKWLGDSLMSLGVEMTAGFLFAWVPFLLLARSPRRWWLYTALLSLPFLLCTVLVKPIWIDPLYNEFGPMKNEVLERSILDQASRAGIEGSRVFEVDKRVDTNAVNAYVTGVLEPAHRPLEHAHRPAQRERTSFRDGSRNGSLRAWPCDALDPALGFPHLRGAVLRGPLRPLAHLAPLPICCNSIGFRTLRRCP